MRTIEFEENNAFNEAETFRTLIANAPVDRGYTIDKVRIASNILAKTIANGVPLKLEEEEWRFAKERVRETQWRMASSEVVTFSDKVLEAAADKEETKDKED